MAKTITGNTCTLRTAAAINTSLRFEYASAPGIHEGQLVNSADDVVADIGLDGTFSTVLATGSYKVFFEDNPGVVWYITVEAGAAETLDIIDIIVPTPGAAPTPSEVIPIASDVAYGKVLLVLGATGAVRVYNQTQLDAVIWQVLAVPTIAALRALPFNENYMLVWVKSDDDGLMGAYWWDETIVTADDDGNSFIALTDPDGGGFERKGV